MLNRLALLRILPPGALPALAAERAAHRLRARRLRRRDATAPTYAETAPAGSIRPLVDVVPLAEVRRERPWIVAAAGLYREHRFDVLGSGWVRVAHGVRCRGVGGTVLDPQPAVTPDFDGRWLEGRVNAANLDESRRIWRLVDPAYVPIDWQLDVKSGFRWPDDGRSEDIAFGARDNVDVKVPWELARMQHLTTLAWAHALAQGGEDGGLAPAAAYAGEFRNQVLDFMAQNPPRYGVNWRCPMDVAIRAANWVLAHDLFRAAGAAFDEAFEALFRRSLLDHGRHVVGNLEWYGGIRGNHYLADVCGLAFVAAALPRGPETDAWLALAAQEIEAEVRHQFADDGGNTEGSTAYHRMTTEMAAFATAVLVGLDEDARHAVAEADPAALGPVRRPLRRPRWDGFPAEHFARLERMAELTVHLAGADGRVPQIGDNDSGRLFALHPAFVLRDAAAARSLYANLDGDDHGPGAHPDADDLDHRAAVAAVAALVDRPDLAAAAGAWLDALVVSGLAGGRRAPGAAAPNRAAGVRVGGSGGGGSVGKDAARTVVLEVTGGGLRDGLALFGYPDFGVWIYRSRRLRLVVRCGPPARRWGCPHAHNDQLSLTLAVDGEDWIADPGTYLYCPPKTRRDAYRSVLAHAAPRTLSGEPASLGRSNFWLGGEGQARCLRFDEDGFVGERRGGPAPVVRRVTIGKSEIVVSDSGRPVTGRGTEARCASPDEARAAFGLTLAVSPGYGKLLRARATEPAAGARRPEVA